MFANFGPHVAKAVRALLTRQVTIDCDCIPFRFDRVPLRKLLNWILVEASEHLRPQKPWGWPTHVQIEPTNRCNLQCALCPISDGLDRPSGDMNRELFERLVNETGKYIFIMMLWDWGEPFLNSGIYDMIAYAKQHGIKTLASTNGHAVKTKQQAERLVRSGLDAMVVAIDGISQQTYQQYRRLGDLDTVFDGMRRIAAAKKALNSPTPLINFRFVVMKHNEHEVPRLQALARSLEADMLTLRKLHPHDAMGLLKGKDRSGAYVPERALYQRYKLDPDNVLRPKRKRNPCKKLWNSTTVHWNGMVCPCCFDPHDRHTLGDLSQTGFREIWTGRSYRNMRRDFGKDYRKIALCTDCTYAFEGGALGTEDFVDVHHFGTKGPRNNTFTF